MYVNFHVLNDEKENVAKNEKKLLTEKEKLKAAADTLSFSEKVFGGTYIQSLVTDELHRRASDTLPNGILKV